ncbi:hypothetical protein SAMN05192539_1001201 [Paraburkholderia diazotrophica]|uniref:Uncharacterized protein n=1 Tax=Paraburkholderia diazotrophica TaxID=667676 RepID=A0A1H6QK76_9BURK|nr:hypothetical protein SAMN05192539_1001201 [Paraburkholderia diazotrophica]
MDSSKKRLTAHSLADDADKKGRSDSDRSGLVVAALAGAPWRPYVVSCFLAALFCCFAVLSVPSL